MLTKLLSAVLALLLCVSPAAAETLTLPASLTRIEDYAFADDTAIHTAVVPTGVESIGEGAFSGCANLGWITLPATAVSLGDGFLSGCAADLLIRTEAGSAACAYAQNASVDYQAGTIYRALLIGQTYPNGSYPSLKGPPNDTAAMQRVLTMFPDTYYTVNRVSNLTANGMLAAISQTFGAATAQDVSLFYYSGHGKRATDSTQGVLVGSDGSSTLSATTLREALDRIPGRKIVIIDACYSGSLLTARGETKGGDSFSAEDFTASFISAFSRRTRSNLSADSYFVMTASSSDEQSYETLFNSTYMGIFTYQMLMGCGYHYPTDSVLSVAADSNGNDVLTLNEVFQYAANAVQNNQHAQVYPTGCEWFGILRK